MNDNNISPKNYSILLFIGAERLRLFVKKIGSDKNMARPKLSLGEKVTYFSVLKKSTYHGDVTSPISESL